MGNQRAVLWTFVGLAAAVLGARLWVGSRAPAQPAEPLPVEAASTAASAPAPAASTPPESPPVDLPVASAEPALTPDQVVPALVDLIGSKAVHSLLQTDDFARRVAATVDNLGRAHAPARIWPVNPTPGRFTTEVHQGGTVVSADNSLRYAPFVLLVETLDMARVAALYRRMSPLLQQAYVGLGYPGRTFEARLLEVIDLLLATPEAIEPLAVRLVEVRGEVPSTRPWVRYEFADQDLEALTAGQKLLLRSGAVNERRLKARLAEFRDLLLESRTRR